MVRSVMTVRGLVLTLIAMLLITACSPSPETRAQRGVDTNADWTPHIETINSVEMAPRSRRAASRWAAKTVTMTNFPSTRSALTRPFWIDVTEVTNAQMGGPNPECTIYSSLDEQPRLCISWPDAAAHCESRGARLPTEAEWEYAARGPDALTYPWGNEFVAANVVYRGSDLGELALENQIPNAVAPVGSRPDGASWVGAHDLSGNLWEWIADYYDPDYFATLSDGVVNPTGPAEGSHRGLRGGSRTNDEDGARATFRNWAPAAAENLNLGFRCALDWQPES